MIKTLIDFTLISVNTEFYKANTNQTNLTIKLFKNEREYY